MTLAESVKNKPIKNNQKHLKQHKKAETYFQTFFIFQKKIKHISRGQAIPFNEYSLMTIELPKPRGVKKYEREFSGHGSPKCEHWRCGHWRRFRDRLGNVTRRIWIKAQKLGNKELGTKITDYKLDKAQGQ